jgi:hypothetical protein
MKKAASGEPDASGRITDQIAELNDWRGPVLAKLRKTILGAAPGIEEEWKWGTAVWASNGLLCSAGVFKDHVKLNFFKGASLKDAKRLFKAGLEAKATRAIDFGQRDRIDTAALRELVRAAVALNSSASKK